MGYSLASSKLWHRFKLLIRLCFISLQHPYLNCGTLTLLYGHVVSPTKVCYPSIIPPLNLKVWQGFHCFGPYTVDNKYLCKQSRQINNITRASTIISNNYHRTIKQKVKIKSSDLVTCELNSKTST